MTPTGQDVLTTLGTEESSECVPMFGREWVNDYGKQLEIVENHDREFVRMALKNKDKVKS